MNANCDPRSLKEKKICVLISAPSLASSVNVSGISAVVSELKQALGDEVHYTHLVLGAPQTGKWYLRKLASLLNILKGMLKAITEKYDILHSNTALMTRSIYRDLPFVLAARISGKAVILHFHGGLFLETKPTGLVRVALKFLIGMSEKIVFLSQTELELFTQHTFVPSRKSISIYNSVRIPKEARTPAADDDSLRVLFAGRLVSEKGVDLVLKAANRCYPASVHFTIYGDGPIKREIETEASVNRALTFGGVFAHADWPEILKNYDILVLPSKVPFEGMPMIVLEAMSLGLVPIATPYGSIPELLGRRERGLLIAPNDVEMLVAAISELASSPETLATMGNRSRIFAKEKFDSSVTSRAFLSLYNDLSSGKNLRGNVE
ncbi:glycosyltransferase family 4 protein [Pleomorphomonas oryzae]|uniref:glycosyltransferase family 4 protein n=1 Tax=Pleomorphomonas oryzae TaxID=261934 RepID=UPI000A0238E9|nr:glycosyltransferase family 4 protein [Pleomorphomonas oryzae]